MKKLFLIISVMCLFGFTSCKSEEEKTEEIIYELIDDYMFLHCPSYPDCSAIELFFEPENYDYFTDSMMLECGNKLVNIDRYRVKNGDSRHLNEEWLGVMDTIRILLETIDTTQQKGYFVTFKYRTTNHIGAYEILIDHFFVNKDLNHIEPYHKLTLYEEMLTDLYLPAAFLSLQNDTIIEAVKNRNYTY